MSRSRALRAVAGTLAVAATGAASVVALRHAVAGDTASAAGAAAFGLLLAGALGLQGWRPGDSAAGLQQLAVAALGAGGAAALADDRPLALLALGLAVAAGVLLLLHPRGGAAATLPDTPSRTLAALALVAAFLYWPHAGLATGGHDGEPVSTTLAAASAGVPLVTLVAALRAHGWRTSAWSAAGAGVLLAAVSLAYPDAEGSMARGWITPSLPLSRWWAGAALLWALAYVAWAEWRWRATRNV